VKNSGLNTMILQILPKVVIVLMVEMGAVWLEKLKNLPESKYLLQINLSGRIRSIVISSMNLG
jgi:hypothetical protein